MCGDVQLKYTILRFIPNNYDNAKEDESNEKDVNRVAPNSDIIDIHYGHTSNTNGIIKGKNEQVAKVSSFLLNYSCIIKIYYTISNSEFQFYLNVC